MKKRAWKSKIKRACNTAGTYQPCFDAVIESLAGIMEMRDTAREELEETGGKAVIEHTNNSGATNPVRNPAMVAVMELEALALTFWKELGLTGKAYRTICGEIKKKDDKPKSLDNIRARIRVVS